MNFDPIDFLAAAVETPSHESVDEMRTLLRETLLEAGIESTVDPAGNLIAEKGSGRPHVLLNTHLDTVAPHHPLERTRSEISGRGSCDAKASIAVMLAAFLAIEPKAGQVTLALTPDEEQESTGAHALEVDADGVIVGEPTGLDVCIAARGRFQGTITIAGRGAHAADPASGANAIEGLESVLAGLATYDDRHGPDPSQRLGEPTLTPTLVSGGEASNRIPAQAELTIDRRAVPPETESEFFPTLETHLQETLPTDLSLTVGRAERDTPFLGGFETDPDADVSTALQAAGAGGPRVFGAATEAAYFAEVAPTVVFGPGVLTDAEGPVAHGEREYVRIEDVRDGAKILTEALESLL
ncbi:MAG: M20 family metallopeptidase [Halodesulfurarchaeum sp.]